MAKKTNRAFWIGGLAVGAAALGVGVYYATKKAALPPQTSVDTAMSTNPDNAPAPAHVVLAQQAQAMRTFAPQVTQGYAVQNPKVVNTL
jgi:hypothetical protein